MKQIAFPLVIFVTAVGLAQAPPQNRQQPPGDPQQPILPDAPSPASPQSSAMWDRIEHLPRGEKIKISYGKGGWDRCRFAGATDAWLFCEPGEDSDQAQEYRIDRARIADFKIDHDERNGRLIYAGIVVGSGLALGIRAAQTSHADPEAAGFVGGLLGAGLGAVVGVPFSCLSGHCVALPMAPRRPMAYGISYNPPRPALSKHRR